MSSSHFSEQEHNDLLQQAATLSGNGLEKEHGDKVHAGRKRAREQTSSRMAAGEGQPRHKSPRKDSYKPSKTKPQFFYGAEVDDDDDYDPKKKSSKAADKKKQKKQKNNSAAGSGTDQITPAQRRIKNLWHNPAKTLQNASGSPLRQPKYDIYRILLHPDSWVSLTPGQKSLLIQLLPDATAAGATTTCPSIVKLLDLDSNNAFRDDCAKWKSHLKSGLLDAEWILSAEEAALRRAAGEFDAEERRGWEEQWGASSSSAPTPATAAESPEDEEDEE